MLRPSLIALALIAPSAQPQPKAADFQVCIMANPAGPLTFKHHQQGGAILRSQGGIT